MSIAYIHDMSGYEPYVAFPGLGLAAPVVKKATDQPAAPGT